MTETGIRTNIENDYPYGKQIKLAGYVLLIGIGMYFQSYNSGHYWYSLQAFKIHGFWFSMCFALMFEITGSIIATWNANKGAAYIKWGMLFLIFALTLMSGAIGHIKSVVTADTLTPADKRKIEAASEKLDAAKSKEAIAKGSVEDLKKLPKKHVSEYISTVTRDKNEAAAKAYKASDNREQRAVELQKLEVEISQQPNPLKTLQGLEVGIIIAGFALLQVLIWVLSFLAFGQKHFFDDKKTEQTSDKIEQNATKRFTDSDSGYHLPDTGKMILKTVEAQQSVTAKYEPKPEPDFVSEADRTETDFEPQKKSSVVLQIDEKEQKILDYLSGKGCFDYTKLTQSPLRKLFDNSEAICNCLIGLSAKGLVNFDNPEDKPRAKWTIEKRSV